MCGGENRQKIYPLVMTFTVRHGKIHHAIKLGKPSISIGAIYTMAMLNNQMVTLTSIDRYMEIHVSKLGEPHSPHGFAAKNIAKFQAFLNHSQQLRPLQPIKLGPPTRMNGWSRSFRVDFQSLGKSPSLATS